MAALAVGCLAASARAEDKANPTGTWKASLVTPDGQTIEFTLKLKAEGDKLTGSITRQAQETQIENGKFKDDQVSFTAVRERDGQKFTAKYMGKVKGDTIKGNIDVEIGGETRKLDWEAKREKDKK
jgi:hypothetical protein